MKILYGLYQPDEGELLIEDSPTRITSPIDAINHGIGMVHQHFMLVPTLTVTENVAMGTSAKGARMNLRSVAERVRELSAYVPEERQRDGAIGAFSVSENMILVNHRHPPMSRRGFLRNGEIRQRSQQLVDEFSVATPGLDVPASNLSGGNLQKLILARELSGSPSVLLASQPTRGVDIGAAEYIHDRLIEQRGSKSVAILLISEDLDEVLGLADRIAVIYEGRIVGEVDAEDADRQGIGLMMAGVSREDPRSPGSECD
jgi:simple sugar transport system ATP-binding protein